VDATDTATLLDLIRARRAELEADGREPAVSDERRAWALMSISARADAGEAEAKRTMSAVERLLRGIT
jgi:hypothetical protein